MQNSPGHPFNPGAPPVSQDEADTIEASIARDRQAWKSYATLPPELERRLLAAAIFRLIGSDMFAANIAELDKQIAEQPFAVHLMSLRLHALAAEASNP